MKQRMLFDQEDLEEAMIEYAKKYHAASIPEGAEINVQVNCSYNTGGDPRDRQGAYLENVIVEFEA